MSQLSRWLVALAWFPATFALAQGAEAGYIVQDLGTLPGSPSSIGISVNSSGMVALVSEYPDFINRVAIYKGGSLQDIGSTPGRSISTAGINDSGDVVGVQSTDDANSPATQRAYLYRHADGSITDLGTLGGQSSVANGINNSGMVVGTSNLAGDQNSHAFSYINGQMHDLGSLVPGGRSYAQAVNDLGHIAGAADTAVNNVGYPSHAILYIDGVYHDLGTLGGDSSVGWGINNLDQVVGYSTLVPGDFSVFHAIVVTNGVMTDLGTLGGTWSDAYSINDSGVIVGNSSTSDGQVHAFVYQNGQMQDLNSLIDTSAGWTLWDAIDINNAGQITGYGVNGRGEVRGFLLTPAAAIPEPTSLILMAMGGLGVAIILGQSRAVPSRGCRSTI